MSKLGAASDLAKRNYFTNQLLYVQHVDKEKDTASTISEQSLHEYLLNNSKTFSDSRFSEYLGNPEANVDILKSSLQDEKVATAQVFTNPLPISLKLDVACHAFVFFVTWNLKTNNVMCYSMEKNGQYIVLQQSPVKEDVMYKLYDPEKKILVKRLGPVKRESFARGNGKELEYLIRAIWKTNQLTTKYNLLFSNCQHFAEFVFKQASYGEKKWSTWISSVVDRIGLRNTKTKSEVTGTESKYTSNLVDGKGIFYNAMIKGRRKDFEDLAGKLTSESLNSVDSLGYTLLEWATVFSTSDWPIDQFLIGKGAKIQTDEGTFRRNVFFIALKFLHPDKDGQTPSLAFDGVDIGGVNQSGDTALHWALYGGKGQTAKKILSQLKNYDVNTTDCKGDTPLYLAIRLKREFDLIKKILARTNSENVNKHNEHGNTALHFAILNQSEAVVEELLKRMDVDVNVKNNNNHTALHVTSMWVDIPIDWFRDILRKSTDVNAQDQWGNTALQTAILGMSKRAVKELLKHNSVDVNIKSNQEQTTLHFASEWRNIPIDLFRKILEKSTDVNAQNANGNTALQLAIVKKCEAMIKELVNHKDVDLNLKDNDYCTALQLASSRNNVPVDLFRIILEKSTDVNAQEKNGHTALHLAIALENRTAVEEVLKHKDVDVNLKNNDNQTALHLASVWKNMSVDLFRKILEKSSDVNAQEIDGHTALHISIIYESKSALEELLKRKDVDFNLKNNNNQTARDFASSWENIPVDLLRIILEKSNAKDEKGNTALHVAIMNKSKTVVGELLKRSESDVNLKNNDKQTALHLACWWNDIPIDLFKIILKKSTDVNVQEEDGDTALHNAIVFEFETAIKELLERKDIDVNIKNNDKRTPLHLALIGKGFPIDLFRIISEKSTNVNLQDRDGHTAFHLAMSRQSTTMIEELLKHRNLDVNLKNDDNQTALQFASVWKNIQIDLFKVILEKSTDVHAQEEDGNTALHLAIMYKSATALKELLKCEEIDLNLNNNKNQTARFLASLWEDIPIDLLRIIQEKSSDVNAQDESGNTALHSNERMWT
ncbi:serine/threonine-protein phosphatase 6 regulatory ankyrin repeat subunit B-like [Daphnia pulicaria]|uniref:serine/threonine-protein phosphatase 6 regulatory ankyrin repeat subunit B-like n=1 Tax=Daphnia pulicaria TaxID=35523 RepID=UPI001EEA7BFB|nr:serine/threonine-protein phosphatase 6 regulatory ankyrin repeat subunit B-like [Daphnia pulicaria]